MGHSGAFVVPVLLHPLSGLTLKLKASDIFSFLISSPPFLLPSSPIFCCHFPPCCLPPASLSFAPPCADVLLPPLSPSCSCPHPPPCLLNPPVSSHTDSFFPQTEITVFIVRLLKEKAACVCVCVCADNL